MAFRSDAFTSSFITGFSFVDDIQRANRAEKRLETRLAEEKGERAFQRKRTNARDAKLDTLFNQQQDDRVDDLQEEELREGFPAFLAQNPDASDEEIAKYAPYSQPAATELARRGRTKRLSDAFETTQGIPKAGDQPTGIQGVGAAAAAGAVVGGETAVDQNQGVAAGGVDAPDGDAQKGTFEGTRGEEGFKLVPEEEITRNSTEFQDMTTRGKIGAVVGGQVEQTSLAITNLLEAAGDKNAVFGKGQSASSAAFGGATFVPKDFKEADEIRAITDPQERQDAETRNSLMLAEQAAAGRDPAFNVLGAPRVVSLQGAHLRGGQLARDRAIREQRQVVTDYTKFLEGGGGRLEEAALKEPSVAAIDYLRNRATLKEAAPNMVDETDDRMVPVFNAYAKEVQARLVLEGPHSPDYRQDAALLKNLVAARDEIANDQPLKADTAGVQPAGLRIGDHERATDTVDTIFDTGTPRVNMHQPGAIGAAATVASRIGPSKRINKNQIEALSVLADAGYVNKATAMSVIMTGHWPPGTDPNGIKSIHSGWALTHNGQAIRLPDAKDTKKPTNIDRTLTDLQLGWASQGAATISMSSTRNNQLHGMMIDHAGFIRKHFNVDNQESMMSLGRVFGQAIFLNASQTLKFDEDFDPFTNSKNVPTVETIMLNPEIRNKLALEFKQKPVPMTAVGRRGDYDIAQYQAGLREGAHGRDLQEAEKRMDIDDLYYAYWVQNATPEQIAAANKARGE